MTSETFARPFWMLTFAISDLRSRISALKVFLACLILGVTLVAATASLYRVIEQSLLADTRTLLSGDVELEASEPLPDDVLAWVRATGRLSLVRELNTMVSGRAGRPRLCRSKFCPSTGAGQFAQAGFTAASNPALAGHRADACGGLHVARRHPSSSAGIHDTGGSACLDPV